MFELIWDHLLCFTIFSLFIGTGHSWHLGLFIHLFSPSVDDFSSNASISYNRMTICLHARLALPREKYWNSIVKIMEKTQEFSIRFHLFKFDFTYSNHFKVPKKYWIKTVYLPSNTCTISRPHISMLLPNAEPWFIKVFT